MKRTIGLLLLAMVMCSPVLADTITFQNNVGMYDGCSDNYMRSDYYYRNYGAAETLKVGIDDGGSTTYQAMVKFTDLFGSAAYQVPATGQIIANAKLKVFVESVSNPSESYTLNTYALTLPVDMGTTNNSNAATGESCWYQRAKDVSDWGGGTHNGPVAGTDYTTTDAASVTFSLSGNGWVEWDVTAIVQKWYAGTLDIEGLLIAQPGSEVQYLAFTAEDGGGNAPALEITYTPEPTTMGLLAMGGLALLRRRK
jgi:hypothetical protein